MTGGLYRIATTLADPLAPLIARLLVRDPRERNERLGHYGAGPLPARPLWMHAASAGEMTGVEPVLDEIARLPEPPPVVLSATTRTGRARAGRFAQPARVLFAPADFPGCVKRATNALAPRALLLMETELWPNLIRVAHDAGFPVAIGNGRITARSHGRMKRAAALYREAVSRLAAVGCQTEADAARFREWGAQTDRVFVHGNTKADQDAPDADSPITRRPGERWILFASVRPGEENAVEEAIAMIAGECPSARFVVGPRHPDRSPFLRTARDRGFSRWSERGQEKGAESKSDNPLPPRIVLDTIGEQASFFAAMDVAFIGGSIADHGGHNPLEAARVGTPVLFGPHMQNCRDLADALLASGGGREVRSGPELGHAILTLLGNDPDREMMADGARAMFESNRGASRRLVHELVARGVLA
ncbi:MAG: hypothetical protein HKN20_16970 [Gemmatimonadetes bacterium]|nr:hypothetical protein [Gemmatimonadota bacterium]